MLWVDKYRPATLDALDVHPELTQQLKKLCEGSAVQGLPHILFFGADGAGKKTRVNALLRAIYNAGVEKLRVEPRAYKVAGGKIVDSDKAGDVLEITVISSAHHIEVNPSDVGPYKDRIVTQAVIKEIAQSYAPGTGAIPYKVVVLNEVDRLSRNAQAALRRTMEKYTASCRFMLICHNPCRVIDPLRSRCVCLRVPAPNVDQMVGVLERVAAFEGEVLPRELALRIAAVSEGNMRRALLALESCKVKHSPLKADQPVEKPDWEKYVTEMSGAIIQEQSPQQMLKIRGMLYELLTNCIPADVVLRRLVLDLIAKCDNSIKPEIAKWGAFFESRLHQGSKPIFHLEAFVLKFMAIYKKWIILMFED